MFNRDPEVIKMALDVLIELEMIEVSEQNVYIVKNFVKDQNIKAAENKKENTFKVNLKEDYNTDSIEDNKKENKEEGKKGSNDNNADDNENLKKEEVIDKNDECKNIDIKVSKFNKEPKESKKKDNIKEGNNKNKRSSINNKNIVNNNKTYNSKCYDDIEGIPLLIDVDSHKNNNINENIRGDSNVKVIDEEVDNIINYNGIDVDIPEEALGTIVKIFDFSDIT
ncbi:phage replisome organizer N-terminal domain-containing protein [Clostridium neonatale]|uniref:phage replisome organizer N-terminal domain-containing protein n=1 Tax=Clostridium neonatale TaxID=137838 RepID=UPI003D337F2A